MLKTVILPTMLYGCELFGSAESSGRIEAVMGRAMRVCLGYSERSPAVLMAVLLRELDVPPVSAQVAARRLRLYSKASSLKTYIRDVATSTSANSWKSRVASELSRLEGDDAVGIQLLVNDMVARRDSNTHPRTVYVRVLKLKTKRYWESWEN